MGKTAFVMNIAENAAIEDQQVVGVFSLEMSREALLMRLLCSQARVDAHKMRTGSLWQDDTKKVVRAMEQLAHAPIFIDDTPGISLSEMRAKARRLKQAQGGRLDLIIVDYLQLMSGGGKRFENRTQEVSAISRGLKALAKELSVPVIALSQLSRAPEAGVEIIAPSWPTCASQDRSSKMPIWSCSFFAKRFTSKTILNCKAKPRSLLPNKETVPSVRSGWHS